MNDNIIALYDEYNKDNIEFCVYDTSTERSNTII